MPEADATLVERMATQLSSVGAQAVGMVLHQWDEVQANFDRAEVLRRVTQPMLIVHSAPQLGSVISGEDLAFVHWHLGHATTARIMAAGHERDGAQRDAVAQEIRHVLRRMEYGRLRGAHGGQVIKTTEAGAWVCHVSRRGKR